MDYEMDRLPYEALVDIRKNGIKLQQRNEAKMWAERERYLMREAEREWRKSQCEVIEIQDNGCVVIGTRNLRIDCKPRILTNLLNPSLVKVIHAEEPEEYLYLLQARILGEYREVFLWGNKLSSPRYILKKMTEIGAEFYGTEAEEKVRVRRLMSVLVRNVSESKRIPEEPGWYIAEDMSMRFYKEGDITWEQAKKLAD